MEPRPLSGVPPTLMDCQELSSIMLYLYVYLSLPAVLLETVLLLVAF